MDQPSGVGVLDKSVRVLTALTGGPLGLGALAGSAGLPRPTAHRLAAALEVHRLLERDGDGRWQLGPALAELAAAAPDRLGQRAAGALQTLRDTVGESAQLYRREGALRRCAATADRLGAGLRDTVPVGALLPLGAGSAGQVLLAWSGEEPPAGAAYDAALLATVRRRGWAHSVGEREPGLSSVSAPVRDAAGTVAAAVSVGGPAERFNPPAVRRAAAAVRRAAATLSG